MNTLLQSRLTGAYVGCFLLALGLAACAVMLYATHKKGPAIFAIINKPGTGGPRGQDLSTVLYFCELAGLFGLLYASSLLTVFLTFGRSFYRERWRRRTVKLDVHLVPWQLKCWILIPAYSFAVASAGFFAVGYFWLKVPLP